MPRQRLHSCAVPGCPALQTESRCPEHRREQGRYRRQSGTNRDEPRDRARRRAVVAAHREQHGDTCPGYGRPMHASTDLTADHIDEIAHGGQPDGPLQVLCRSCNSSKAAARRRDATPTRVTP